MTKPIITAKNITKIYPAKEGRRRVEVIKDISLSIHEGEFLVILGPSGSGKSTLLRIMSGLIPATSGKVIYGKKFSFNNMSFVFQNFGILPWLTVFENIELGLIGRGVALHIREKKIKKILEDFDLSVFRNHYPHELSGGMKQRVGLARAFVTEPDVIFLDEPFSELDFFTAATLRNLLLDMWRDLGTTVVMVSHNVEEALVLGDRIAIFSDRPTEVRGMVTNYLHRPRHIRTPEFFKLEDEVLSHFAEKKLVKEVEKNRASTT